MRVEEFVEISLPACVKGGTKYHSTVHQTCGTIGKRFHYTIIILFGNICFAKQSQTARKHI